LWKDGEPRQGPFLCRKLVYWWVVS
jgi:hypothetical protein